jgi:phage shock protein E
MIKKVVFFLLSISLSFNVFAADKTEPVWIDVRTAVEHKLDSIDGDIRIPHDEIVGGISDRFTDKNIPVRLYCRSGGRAGEALTTLREAGYTDVENAGSIDDARKLRGLK